jgi:hypothetical protein
MSAVEHMEYLKSKIPTAEESMRRARKHLQKIETKTKSAAAARKEREQRRRRVLVDQNAMGQVLEQEREQDGLIKKLLRTSEGERRVVEQLWRDRQYKRILEENRNFAEQQERELRQKRYNDALAKDTSHFESDKRKHEDLVHVAMDRLVQVDLEANLKATVQHENYCRGVVGKVVDLSVKAAHYRDLTDKALIPPAIWQEWTTLFIKDLSLLPSSDTADTADNKSVATADGVATAVAAVTADGADGAAATTTTVAAVDGDDSKTEEGDATTATTTTDEEQEDVSAAVKAHAAAQSKLIITGAGYEIDRAVQRSMRYISDVSEENAVFIDDSMFESYLTAEGDWAVGRQVLFTAPKPEDIKSTHATPRGGGAPVSARGGKKTHHHHHSKEVSSGVSPNKKKVRGALEKKQTHPQTAVDQPDSAAAAATAATAGGEAAAKTDFVSPLALGNLPDPALAPLAPEEQEPVQSNVLFGAVVEKVFRIASGAEEPPIIPEIPSYPLGVVVVGKSSC